MIATRKFMRLFALMVVFAAPAGTGTVQAGTESAQTLHLVQPGDTWTALAIRYSVAREALKEANPHPNPARNPIIGDTVNVPATEEGQRLGDLHRVNDGGLLALAVRSNISPWQLAAQNGIANPFRPLHYRAILVSGGESPPRDLPLGFQSLELSTVPAQPGWPLAFRAHGEEVHSVVAQLGTATFDSFVNTPYIVGVGGTGAFFSPGAPELTIRTNENWLWSQPWRVSAGAWNFDQVTLTGEAAAIDQAAIAAERERMFEIWSQITPKPLWHSPFRRPIDNFLQISSTYGARRSYNGGPYSSYHEGVDFSAYRGTPVFASGDGIVVLAEKLYVRGGAVVIDHGLGIFSGYYHMSAVHAQPGQALTGGELIGEVGTEGLSSGNHLHWDFLVAETWVDATAWQQQNLACWILQGWGTPCDEGQ